MDLALITSALYYFLAWVGLRYRKHDRTKDSATTADALPTRRDSYADRSRSDAQSGPEGADLENALLV